MPVYLCLSQGDCGGGQWSTQYCKSVHVSNIYLWHTNPHDDGTSALASEVPMLIVLNCWVFS